LVAVAYVDALPEALSAIYCYHDPAERARSLGTFNILSLIAAARERRLPHVYLGYYVAGCRSSEYKRRFRPNEVLRPDGSWVAFDAE
jgi:arginine-tRNA-protein transferase